MVNLIRRFQQPLMIVLTILTILAFVVLYNLPTTRSGGFRTDSIGTIYGHNISQTDVQRAGRRFEVCRNLMLFDLLRSLTGNARSMNEAQENFVWNLMVLRHEAEALGIMSATPNEAERAALAGQVKEKVVKMPAFQTNGAFDFGKYNAFLQAIGSLAMTATDLEDVIADDIRLEKVKEVVGATVAATPDEVRAAYTQGNQKLEVSLVRLKLADFKAAAVISDDDVKKLFEERKETLKTPEKRKVKFAAFTLAADKKSLTGADRVKAMQELVDKAQGLAEAMTAKEADFTALATQAGATLGETPVFAATQPPALLENSQPAAQAAFKLTKEQPNSDVIRSGNGYYVLQLSGIEESRPLALEETKGQLTEQLRQERGQEAMNLKATEIRTKVEAEIKAGKTFAQAAEAAGVKAEKLPVFSPTEPPKDADAQAIGGQAADLAEGQVSEFTPTPAGGLILQVEKRLPIDEAAFEKERTNLTENQDQQKREAVFADWLRARTKAANLQFGHA